MKALIVVLTLSLVPSFAFARCGPSSSSGQVTKPKAIDVTVSRGDAPAFYLSPSGRHLTLYFTPDDLLARLQADLAARPEPTADQLAQTTRLLHAIEADLPLKEPLDARKYAQQGGGLYWRFEYLVADLMSEGKVVVDEDPPGDKANPASIVMVSESKAGKEKARYFCSDRGKELLTVLYVDQ